MTLRPYKFIVQAVVQQVEVTKRGDAIGEPPYEMAAVPGEIVVGEAETEPVVIFGCDALAKWAAEFTDKLAAAEEKSASAG